MTDQEFEQLILSKVKPEFKPLAIYDADNDSLEIMISNESYRMERTGDSCVYVYVGRESAEITGAIIKRYKKRYVEDPSHVWFEVNDKNVKTSRLLKLIRERQGHVAPVTVKLLIERLEKMAEDNELETDVGGLVGCGTYRTIG
jgi:hypothetical protein